MPRINVKDKRKQQLMEANIASIARRGLADTTIAHVSKGAGMSRGIVNFYFTSKEKMMQETLHFLAEEVTMIVTETIKAGREKQADPFDIAEAVLRALMSDRLCSHKRMAVWSAFIGHAGTHAASARTVRAMDDTLTAQLKKLWQEAGFDNKSSEMHARQLQALIRGHWLMSALGDDQKRPSAFIEAWVELLRGEPSPPSSKDKVIKLKASVPGGKARKTASGDVPANQLDFGDLFS